jgi:hypothetical protein
MSGANMAVNLPPIDDPRTPIGQAMSECEVHCVPACCGMDAYQISSEHLQRWADRVTRSTFNEVTEQVDHAVDELKSAPESFFFLDAEHSRAEVTAWFLQVRAAFAATRPAD